FQVIVGSPPRAWGRHLPVHVRQPVPRFTPTCVGKAASRPRWGRSGSVHPHVRGEGAPPPASPFRLLRFTPTCVGKAIQTPPPSTPTTVHPHVRGEGGVIHDAPDDEDGSPPRAWGRPLTGVPNLDSVRFTPTCVG